MSYLGQTTLKASDIRRVDVTSSTSATHTLTWEAPNEQSLIVTINGVKQQNNYTVSGTTLTLDTALITTDELEVIGINDIGTTITPAEGSVNTAQLANDAVTADKLANSINTDIAANTAKVTNATHTGDVTGATALTIAADAVDIAMLSATGTASASTFLRGDNAWAAAGGANTPSFHAYMTSYTTSWSSGAWTKVTCPLETFDTDSDYDTTLYRFTPSVAGKYFIYGQFSGSANSSNINNCHISLYKNGAEVWTNRREFVNNPQMPVHYPQISSVIDFNGSSDYVELFGYLNVHSGVFNLSGYDTRTFFGGFRLL